MKATNKEDVCTIVVIGGPGVGKTTFVKKFIHFDDRPTTHKPTIGFEVHTKHVTFDVPSNEHLIQRYVTDVIPRKENTRKTRASTTTDNFMRSYSISASSTREGTPTSHKTLCRTNTRETSCAIMMKEVNFIYNLIDDSNTRQDISNALSMNEPTQTDWLDLYGVFGSSQFPDLLTMHRICPLKTPARKTQEMMVRIFDCCGTYDYDVNNLPPNQHVDAIICMYDSEKPATGILVSRNAETNIKTRDEIRDRIKRTRRHRQGEEPREEDNDDTFIVFVGSKYDLVKGKNETTYKHARDEFRSEFAHVHRNCVENDYSTPYQFYFTSCVCDSTYDEAKNVNTIFESIAKRVYFSRVEKEMKSVAAAATGEPMTTQSEGDDDDDDDDDNEIKLDKHKGDDKRNDTYALDRIITNEYLGYPITDDDSIVRDLMRVPNHKENDEFMVDDDFFELTLKNCHVARTNNPTPQPNLDTSVWECCVVQ